MNSRVGLGRAGPTSLGGQPDSPQDLERHSGGEGTIQDSGLRAAVVGVVGKLLGCAWRAVKSPLLVGGLDWEVGEAALPEPTIKMPF